MKFRLVILFIVLPLVALLANFAQAVPASESDETSPALFATQQEAAKNGCKKVYLKGRDRDSCVVEAADMHTFLITVYDKNSKGQFVKSDQLCFPSWYGKASVEYKDILPDGKQLMFVKFEGNTGTGTLQMILMIVRWQNNHFVPVLAETVSYDLASLGSKQELKASYALENVKTKELALNLKYEFGVVNETNPAMNVKDTWSDRLIWDEKSGSFDSDEQNQRMLKAPSYVQRNIARVRQSLRSIKIFDLCDGFFEKTGIMEILTDDRSRTK